jgi:DNA-binding transcriptional MerR regulator
MTIGEIAQFAGVTRDTIRYFERTGLLDPPRRDLHRHRVYEPAIAERVRLIRQLQNCGLTIEDIRQVLDLARREGVDASSAVVAILQSRLDFITDRLTHLRQCCDRLKEAITLCSGARSGVYSMLSSLPDSTLVPPFRFGRRGTVQ